jgi:hypothetical protein
MKKPSLEVHIPISPNEHFFTMNHYLLESFKVFAGEIYENTKFVFTVGSSEPWRDLSKELDWAKDYNVEWRWLDPKVFNKYSYFATAVERFKYKFESDMVLMLDADTMITGSLDNLIQHSYASNLFTGRFTPRSPFRKLKKPDYGWWRKIFREAGVKKIGKRKEKKGKRYNGKNYHFFIPYFNHGVLLAPSRLMSKIGSTIYDEMEAVERVKETVYKCQIGVCLAVMRHRIPYQKLPKKFNFTFNFDQYRLIPNDILQDVRICHYAGRGPIQKRVYFQGQNSIENMVRTNFAHRCDQFFQRKVQAVHNSIKNL